MFDIGLKSGVLVVYSAIEADRKALRQHPSIDSMGQLMRRRAETRVMTGNEDIPIKPQGALEGQ